MIFVYSHTIIDDVRRTIIPSARVNKDPHGTSSRSLRNRESKPRRDRDVVERVRKNLEDSSESLYPQHTSIHRWACKLSNPSTPAGSQLNASILASSASAVGASAVLVLTNFDSVQEVFDDFFHQWARFINTPPGVKIATRSLFSGEEGARPVSKP